jgi:uncharacterized protein YndB with AHSA1/START domain
VAPNDDLIVELDRILPGPRERVFGEFATAERLARWWGPRGFSVRSIDFDPRVGNAYRIEMQPPEGEPFFLAGEFRAVEPGVRLAFTFVYEEPDPDDVETLVELAFDNVGEATRVVFRQGPFRTEARRDLHRDGWSDTLDRLRSAM